MLECRGPVLDGDRAEPAGRDRPARRAARRGQARADEALANARAGRRQVERGLRAGHPGRRGGRARAACAEAAGGAEAALARDARDRPAVGRARTLLGLGDLARLHGDLAAARQHYQAALGILREVDARPEIARCLAGLGRIAMDSGRPGRGPRAPGREPAAEPGLGQPDRDRPRPVRRSPRWPCARTGPDRAVQLAAAVTALRATAQLPPLPGSRTQRYLDAAVGLGEPEVARLWAAGQAMSSTDAVRLALGEADEPAAGGRPGSRLSGRRISSSNGIPGADRARRRGPGSWCGQPCAARADRAGARGGRADRARGRATRPSPRSCSSARPPPPGTWPTSWASWASARAARSRPGPGPRPLAAAGPFPRPAGCLSCPASCCYPTGRRTASAGATEDVQTSAGRRGVCLLAAGRLGVEQGADRLALVDPADRLGQRRGDRDHVQLRRGTGSDRDGVGADDLRRPRAGR